MARAVLFDIDGTLIDSVDLHARAWQEAFAHFGKKVRLRDMRAQIGKGADQILPAFLQEDERERFGDELDEYRVDVFRRKYLPLTRAFPQARELLARLKQSGALVGLASSCQRIELGYYLRMVGGASLVDAATTADETKRSKPHPDVLQLCLEKLDVKPGDAVAVGDSPYDAEAAAAAGITAVGVRSGVFRQEELEAAGCIAVYKDVAELLARIASSPLAPEGTSTRE